MDKFQVLNQQEKFQTRKFHKTDSEISEIIPIQKILYSPTLFSNVNEVSYLKNIQKYSLNNN